jgi:hypothetical protein
MCDRAELVEMAQGWRNDRVGDARELRVIAAGREAGRRHGYLSVPLPAKGPVALRIIDESFWQALCDTSSMEIGTWLAGPQPLRRQRKLQHIKPARRAVYEARRDGSPLCAALRAIGVDVDQLESFARFEMDEVARLELSTDLPEDEQKRRIKAFDAGAWRRARRRAGIWRLLAGTLHLDDTERLVLETEPHPTDAGELRQTLVRHSLQPLALDAPTIVMTPSSIRSSSTSA